MKEYIFHPDSNSKRENLSDDESNKYPARREPKRFLSEIYGNYPCLSDEKTMSLFEEIEKNKSIIKEEANEEYKKNSEKRISEIKEEIVLSNIRLVVYSIKKFVSTSFTSLDLIQEGVIGLMSAVDKFDSKRGKFSTFAIVCIENAIINALQNNDKLISIAVNKIEKFFKYKKVKRELEQELKKELTVKEIAEEMGISMKEVSKIAKIAEIYQMKIASLDEVIPVVDEYQNSFDEDEEDSLGDIIPDKRDFTQEIIEKDLLEKIFKVLFHLERVSFRNKEIFLKHFGLIDLEDDKKIDLDLDDKKIDLGLKEREVKLNSFAEIGKGYGLSGERVRMIVKSVLERIQKSKNLI